MKLSQIIESYKYEAPSPDAKSVQDAKLRFKKLIAAGVLYHQTRKENVESILANGFVKNSFFSFNKVNLLKHEDWVTLSVKGSDVADDILPDPEHMYASHWISDLMTVNGWSSIEFERVITVIDKDILPWIFFGIQKKISTGFWLVCSKPIDPKLIIK
jgi:hypothetical protein